MVYKPGSVLLSTLM